MCISVVGCENYSRDTLNNALEEMFYHLGGIQKFIKPGAKVLLKPNLVIRKRPEKAATTHPALVEAVVGFLKKYKADVILADSPGGLYTKRALKGVYSVCGMDATAQKTGLKLNYDLSEINVDNPDGELLKKVSVIKPIKDVDFVINLPKLKTHGQMVYTGAVKNMFGAVAGELKAEYHLRMPNYADFANVLIDIFLSVRPELNIMDAVVGMDGAGPTAGNPKKIGLLIGGEDAFTLDFTALNIVGIEPEKVPLIKQAVRRGLCPAEISNIEVRGVKPDKVRVFDFDFPKTNTLRDIGFYENKVIRFILDRLKPKPVFNSNICTGCGYCTNICPACAITMSNNKPQVDLSKCIRCFCCQELCPAGAVSIKRPFITDMLSAGRKKHTEKKDF